MTEQLFEDVKTEVKIVEGEDGSIKIGETVYKDKEAAFKGKAEADKHIAITQVENKELRDRVKTLEDSQSTALTKLLERVDEQTTQSKSRQGDDGDYSYQEVTTDTAHTTDPEEIRRLVQEQIKSNLDVYDQSRQVKELAETKAENLVKIREDLVKKFGSAEEAKAAWETYVAKPEFDQEIYEMQVLRTPDAIVEAMSPTTPVSFGQANLPTSAYTGSSESVHGPKPRSYWGKMMKENSRKYYSVENQRQMKADFVALGEERFFNN